MGKLCQILRFNVKKVFKWLYMPENYINIEQDMCIYEGAGIYII